MTENQPTPRRRVTDFEDPALNEALADALGGAKLRKMDRRLLWLYAFTTAVAIFLTFLIGRQVDQNNHDRLRFEAASIANCVANQDNTRHLNDFITAIQQTYRTSPVLTPAEIEQRVAFMEKAKTVVPDCPPEGLHRK